MFFYSGGYYLKTKTPIILEFKDAATLSLTLILGYYSWIQTRVLETQHIESYYDKKKSEMRYALEKIITPLYTLIALDEFPPKEDGEKEYFSLYDDDAKLFKDTVSRYRYLLPKEIDYMDAPNVGGVFLEQELVDYIRKLYDLKIKEYSEFVKSH